MENSADNKQQLAGPHESQPWEYPPPPTAYDTVHDGLLIRGARLTTHAVMNPFIRSYFHLKQSGVENVLDNWPCIIAPNHQSHLDTAIVFASLPLNYVSRTCVLAARDYFFRNSLVSFGARLVANIIPIDRVSSEMRGLLICLGKLKQGRGILMFPEGTRSASGKVGDFKEGAISLSRNSRRPIVPAYITGTWDSLPRGRTLPARSRVSIVFGKPLEYWSGEKLALEASAAASDLRAQVLALGRECGI